MTVFSIRFRCRHCEEVVDVEVTDRGNVRLSDDEHDCYLDGDNIGYFNKFGFDFAGARDEDYEIEVVE